VRALFALLILAVFGCSGRSLVADSSARWSRSSAAVDEDISMVANLDAALNGSTVRFRVWERGADISSDQPVAVVMSTVRNGQASGVWAYSAERDPLYPRKDYPRYFFTAGDENGAERRSGLVRITAWVSVRLVDWDNKPLARTRFRLVSSSGREYQGVTDDNGEATVENLVPAEYSIVPE
jgi:hypothetical protein